MKKNYLLLFCFLVSFCDIFGQSSTDTVKKDVAKIASSNVSNVYSPQTPNPFEIGISGGLHLINGDINSYMSGVNLDNSTFGFHIRKGFGYHFSLRLQYNYGTATMRHGMPHFTAVANNIPGASATNSVWFVGSQAYSHSLMLDNVFSFGNTSIHKPKTKLIYEVFAGPAMIAYRTKLNTLDANNQSYNWSEGHEIYDGTTQIQQYLDGDLDAISRAYKWMDNTLDDTYETLADDNRVKNKIFDMALTPAITFGAGIAFKLNDRLNLGLEQRLFYIWNDYIDGERWANFTTTQQYSQSNDVMSNTTLKLNCNLGKEGTMPKYWQNENEYIYNKVAGADNSKLLKDAFADDDFDGVPNRLDDEADSKEGYPVDTKGKMLDSDKDGVLDGIDVEPFSPAGYPIDDKGKAIVPPPACCQQIMDNMKTGQQPTPSGNVTSSACAETSLPAVRFNKDKYGLSEANESSLRIVGEKLQACPDMRIVVAGINDKNSMNGKYNEQLSYNRANEVANYLSDKYGISRERFIVKFNQEGNGDKESDRAVMFRNAQTGEYGNSNPASPHPGLKAGNK